MVSKGISVEKYSQCCSRGNWYSGAETGAETGTIGAETAAAETGTSGAKTGVAETQWS